MLALSFGPMPRSMRSHGVQHCTGTTAIEIASIGDVLRVVKGKNALGAGIIPALVPPHQSYADPTPAPFASAA